MNGLFSTEIMPGIYRISDSNAGPAEDGFSSAPGKPTRNSYLICGNLKAILFDLALEQKELKEYAEQLTALPIQLILSHGHIDHIYNLNLFDEAYLHPADFNLVKNGTLDIPPQPCCKTLHALHGTEKIDLGNRIVEVIHFPGHTDGGLLLLDHATHTLLSGDVVSRRLLFNFPGTTGLDKFCQALHNLQTHDIDIIYTAHDRCGLPKSHLAFMLDVIEKELPNAATTWESPFGGTMRQCICGEECSLKYFDICAV